MESLRTFCANLQKIRFIASGKGAGSLRKCRGNPRKNFCNNPFPNDPTLKTLTSLNEEVRPFFLSDNSIWSFLSGSSLSDYSIWRS